MSSWVATDRVAAEVMLAEGLTYQGELHVQNSVPYRDGPETPLEMLNRAEPFFVLSLPTGGVLFLAKAQVAVVTCEPAVEVVDPQRASVATRVHLRVILAGGAEYDGWAEQELPPTRARALDFLNGPEPFFPLHTEGALRHLRRAHVRAVTPLD